MVVRTGFSCPLQDGDGKHKGLSSPSIARTVNASKDDGAETQSGLRADPGAVPGASTLAA